MKQRNQPLKKKALLRDNFTCQKCKIQDKTGNSLEAHHVVPLCYSGENSVNNLITLCSCCHHFAPDKKEEFEEYMQGECTGIMGNLLKAWHKVRKEHPELLVQLQEEAEK